MTEAESARPAPRRSRWTTRVVVVSVVVAFLLIFTVRALQYDDSGRRRGVGGKLPALELAPLTGASAPVTLDDLKGKVTLVNFWATWCKPCQQELPALNSLAKSLSGNADFRLLAVSCGEESPDLLRANTEAMLQSLRVDLPTHADPGRVTRRACDRVVGFRSYPTTLLLDRDGAIRAVWRDAGSVPEIEARVKRLIEGKSD